MRLPTICVAVLAGACLATGCGGSSAPSPPGTGAASGTSAAAPPASSGTGSSASCAAMSARERFAAARIVAYGQMRAGPMVGSGTSRFLASPARFVVWRYLKGHGPRTVTVITGGRGHTFAEDGIRPQPGERWEIFTRSARTPWQTSLCAGSHRYGLTMSNNL